MPAALQPADPSPAAARSEKSNTWSPGERIDIYSRRRKGEHWDTICPDYPHRTKHAMEQQVSMMKKQSAPVTPLVPSSLINTHANEIQKTPVKSNEGRRKSFAKAPPPAVNGGDGADDESEDESSSGQDEADSEDVNTIFERRKSTRKGRPRRAPSEESVKPKRRKSAPQLRLSKRLKRSAKDQSADESDEPERPVSARPRRTRAPPINYSLLQNFDLDQNGASDSGVAREEPKRKSKIIALRTGPPKKHLLSPRNLDGKTPRRKVSVGDGTTAKKTPMVEDVSATRKSTRGKKFADDDLADDEGRPNLFRGELDTPRRKRRRRLLAHEDSPEKETSPVVTTESISKPRKRKRSENGTDKANGETAGANDMAEADESQQPEKKRRKSKIREDLGFLPNGQPRKRRRRRTRQEMLLDRQTPKTVTTRRRGKYQFPYLPGYNGPTPPDMATVLARQDEVERQNGKSHSTADNDSGSSLASLSDDDGSELESPIKRTERSAVQTEANPIPPNTQAPVSATSVAPMVPKATVVANTSTAPVSSETISLNIPDVIFFAEDVAKARENAAKLRASFEAEKASVRLASKTEVDSERKAVEAELAQEKERVTELTQQIADLREGFATRMNAEKQEHERAVKALKASLDEKEANLHENLSTVSRQLKASDHTIKERDDTIKARNDTIKAKENIITTQFGTIRAREDTIKQLKETQLSKDKSSVSESRRPSLQPTNETPRPPTPAKPFSIIQALSTPIQSPTPTPAATTNANTKAASQIKADLKPHVSSLRNSHIRLAGHLRTTNEAHGTLKSSIERLHTELVEDEITMRGVTVVVKGLVEEAGKVSAELKKAGRESDGVKGGVMELMDKVEH
ncbi:MAG: hypothetical protein Q9184_005723 [Pyrenodesmia sp. 2 TL-2023]